jgi:Fe-S-cluster containining protein
MDTMQFQAGLDRLAQPVLPLVRLVQILFLTGPFDTVEEVVDELREPIDTVVSYQEPATALAPYLDLMAEFQRLKDPAPTYHPVLDTALNPLSALEAIDLWVAQQVVTRELEAINSLLCRPCGCSLCCTGPSIDQRQVFFEIPLAADETALFPAQRIDTPATQGLTAGGEPPLLMAGRPFYEQEEPALYRWRTGWSMILPRGTACPHLQASRTCAIYPDRPLVCRRPQVFAYLIDHLPDHDLAPEQAAAPVFRQHGKVLAIWDCPYVKRFQQEIAAYAERCELEPIFKENKA